MAQVIHEKEAIRGVEVAQRGERIGIVLRGEMQEAVLVVHGAHRRGETCDPQRIGRRGTGIGQDHRRVTQVFRAAAPHGRCKQHSEPGS